MGNQQVDETLQQIREQLYKAAETTATYTHSPQTRSVFSPENLDEKITVCDNCLKDSKMKNLDLDKAVIVCDYCHRASCWNGIFKCDKYHTTGTTTRTVKELIELKLEHIDYIINS